MQRFNKSVRETAFTLVELMIVIVVIVILATITFVAYEGIQRNAAESAVQSDLSGAAKEIILRKSREGCPADANDIPKTSTTVYTSYSCGTGADYCIQASHTRYTDISYYIDDRGRVSEGSCVL